MECDDVCFVLPVKNKPITQLFFLGINGYYLFVLCYDIGY